MEQKIILVAETGSDITPEMAEEYGIFLVPMHVSMGEESLDDGTFPPEEVCRYYERTGKVPHTSASSPEDFSKVFDEIHQKWPGKHILHLAYSAVTTCSYLNAVLVSENRDYVTSFDTKHVSVGQASVVIKVAEYLKEHPDAELSNVLAYAESIAERTQMCFIPENLDYLKAGGRVSNAKALIGTLLNLHPCIEIINGLLLAKKKYRGSLKTQIPKLIDEFTHRHHLAKDHLYFIESPGLDDAAKRIAEASAAQHGYNNITWMKTGCVITCHGGSGCFGIVGLTEKD